MTSESKILTVSYGTFSCTLEGFDDPFDTMKAIAEYFRELAAQDRHFGAEPPPPDAAMLHRLAEREVSRLAGTSPRDDTVLLNQDAVGTGPAAASGPRIQINTPARRRIPRDPNSPDFSADDDIATPEPALQDVIPDGVAAKLARIRQAVHPIPVTMAAPFAPFSPYATEPEITEDEVAEPEFVEAEATITEDEVEAVSALDAAVDADILTEVTTDLPPATDIDTDAEADVAFDGAADADTLIEAEADTGDVAGFDDEAPTDAASAVHLGDSWYEEGVTEGAEPDALSADDAEVDLAAELAEDASVMAAEAPSPEPAKEDASAVEVADELPPDVDATEDDATQDDTDEDVALLAELDGVALSDASLAAALDDRLPEDEPADISLADAGIQDPLPEAALVEEVAAEPEPIAPVSEPEPPIVTASGRTRRLNSRVVRLHPDTDLPEAANPRDMSATRVLDSEDEADEIARLMQQAEAVMAEDENRRRQEALSHLKAAVASTEADRADVFYEAPKAEVSLDPYRGDLAEAIVPDAAEAPSDPSDVRPRRKTVSVRQQEPRPGTIRPGMISPPPLVLVSEQRIDRVPLYVPPAAPPAAAPSISPAIPGIGAAIPEGQPMVALRTGRLSGAIGAGAALASPGMAARNLVLEKPSYGTAPDAEEDEELAEDTKEIDDSGLAAFAEIVGAKSMADMLEAAAAYATCVENRTQFTRPQLMRRMMASAGGNAVSREDGLRSFGTLLRTGRIEKVTRGHYSLAESSPYLAEARRLT